MPIHEYRCACGRRFEGLLRRTDSPDPACPGCGAAAHRIPSAAALSGQADPGPSREQMPQTWRGTYCGDREYVTGLRRRWERRAELEQRHPELAGDTRPVHAHEGRFHGAPLRSGDPLPAEPGHRHAEGT
ncbi:zinc ribbon domain-containing protein [Saccharopolyspora sp. HNM0983]|uniref:Zinc ribbon domain-containing protein n=1 Tax=Saccharopolyspora montiporae TaxID=2781240 RepID=A0A929BBX1_9PSEU|nr:zinc ribbon domain-containing protein [Saccharopolyspora sp. HNM0983]MBE9375238.1 zinc ribbon domain-containing protein [Saccharopolyspora sp. HNM0983]